MLTREEYFPDGWDHDDFISGEDHGVYRVRPVWEPFNSEAEDLVFSFLENLNLTSNAGSAAGYICMVSSMLFGVRNILRRRHQKDRRGRAMPLYLGATLGNDRWSMFPKVGRQVAANTFASFEEAGLLEKVPGSGKRHFYETVNSKLAYSGVMTMWTCDTSFMEDPRFDAARYIETGRPLVSIKAAETQSQKKRRERHGDLKKRLAPSSLCKEDKVIFDQNKDRIARQCAFWRKHPLVLPDGTAAACAERIFSDGSMDVGGRLYGRWTNMSSKDRLECQIDGEFVLSLDIAASQPTLLSALLGIKMKTDNGTWYDPYLQLSNLYFAAGDGDASSEDAGDVFERSRRIAKSVVMELIGLGNPKKSRPSEELAEKTGITKDQFVMFRDALVEAIPALKELEPRYDAKGELAGYVNGPAFLAYHESEIMLLVLECLRDEHQVPAYPVHDCLLVKERDFEVALDVFTTTISDYCEKLSGMPIIPAMSVSMRLLGKRILRGTYDVENNRQLDGCPRQLAVLLSPETRKKFGLEYRDEPF